MPLQNLNLVAIRVRYEEEFRHQGAVTVEFLHRIWIEAELFKPLVFGVNVADRKRQMAVAGAVGICLCAAMVDGQLDFKIIRVVLEVNQREAIEIKAVFHFQAESLAVKIDGLRFVHDPYHCVNGFRHDQFPIFACWQ